MSESATPVEAGWEEIMASGETILWQGRPDGRIAWRDILSMRSLNGAVFAAFAVAWMMQASWVTGLMAQFRIGPHRSEPLGGFGGYFPYFGLIFLGVGLYSMAGRLVWDAIKRRRTWYTLTDRAAYIATDLLGRKLDRHELRPDQPLELNDGEPGAVWFAERLVHHPGRWTAMGDRDHYQPPYTARHRVGFERIADPRTVWRLLREAQGRESAQT
jgi:hypothetical protein